MRYALVLLGALLLAGCGVDLLMTTAIQGEMQAKQAVGAKRVLDQAKVFKGTTEMESAIRIYRGQYGENPPSLEYLVPGYLAAVPRQPDGSVYGYDPLTGRISNEPPPANNALRDRQTIQTILAAIQQFGTATGFYPGTLDELYPRYLREAPRTLDGQQFVYNNQNGEVRLPYSVPTQPGRRPAAPGNRRGGMGGGSGAMGEMVTGMGVSQQLNSMGQSGVSSASSRSRQKLRSGAVDPNQRINDAMKDLDL